MSQHRVGSHATTVARDSEGVTRITYHQTVVVAIHSDKIVLDTGGWRTATTKTRMNQAASEYGLNFQVYQKDFDWFVTFKGETIPFNSDTLTLKG